MADAEYTVERKVIKMCDSLLLTLPPVWIKAHDIKRGDKIILTFGKYDFLKVIPVRKDALDELKVARQARAKKA